jgi:hypothetical protein
MDHGIDESISQATEKSEMSIHGKKRLQNILREYENLFPDKMPGLPPKRGFEHEIILQDEKPVHRMPNRLYPVERETMRKQINEMLDLVRADWVQQWHASSGHLG